MEDPLHAPWEEVVDHVLAKAIVKGAVAKANHQRFELKPAKPEAHGCQSWLLPIAELRSKLIDEEEGLW